MTFFHFVNCVALSYTPYFLAFKYSGLSEYCSIYKCLQATVVYFLTQLAKMLLLATFFPTSDLDNSFDLIPEFLKNSADVLDLIGLHITINYIMNGKGEIRFLAAGFGWALSHSVSNRIINLWIGARSTAFHWKYIQSSLESNIDLVLYVSMAALVWLFSRKDLPATFKRLTTLLLGFCVYHVFVYQSIIAFTPIRSWLLLALKAVVTSAVAVLTLISYSGMKSVSSYSR